MKRTPILLSLALFGCGSDVSVGTTKVVHHYVEVPAEAEAPEPTDTDDTPQDVQDDDEEPDDLPYVVDDPADDADPLASPEDITLAVEEALALVIDTDPELAFPAIQDALTHGDAYCPYYNTSYAETYGYDYWYGGCTSEAGDHHEGTIYGKDDLPYASSYYEMNRYGWWQSDYGIQMADGQRFDVTGYLYTWDAIYIPTGERIVSITTRGFGVHWQGGAWSDTWLGDQRNLDFVAYMRNTVDGEVYLDIDGSLSTGGGPVEAVLFDDVFLHSAGYGADCELEPSGRISVRLDDGRWYDVHFDGAAYQGASVFPPDCDGCGEVWSRGELLGTACPDLSALSEWEGRPWE